MKLEGVEALGGVREAPRASILCRPDGACDCLASNGGTRFPAPYHWVTGRRIIIPPRQAKPIAGTVGASIPVPEE